MADLSITISNRIHVVVPQTPSYLGTMEWGTGYWRSSRDTAFDVTKGIANGVAFASTQGFGVEKYISEGISFGTAVGKDFTHKISNSIGVTSAMDLVSLTQGVWSWRLQGVTDPNDRGFPTWTEDTDPADSWTEGTDPTTTWTEN